MDAQGYHFGTVWRDNTEQDFSLRPEAFIRETKLSRINPEWKDQVAVKGLEEGDEQVMPSLDVAAGWVWGYGYGFSEGRKEARREAGPDISSQVMVQHGEGFVPSVKQYVPEAEEHAVCVRCGRDVPRRLMRTIREQEGGGLACAPVGDRSNYDACQRIYNTV
ncbi:hypothetical protein OG576_37915 [Streptomyces sp. NBC_01500]|nr:hypothetical protein [Streptomyces sp. NBC_01500]MCX4554190.1 hypothetical protein [Streptomyces sp. NBC_01500]MCX4554530.1 hypothetical protein [Streptomyces sp. NBC_01500]